MTTKTFAAGLASVACVAMLLAAEAHAQTAVTASGSSYAMRPLRMIIPAGAGGGVDTVARVVGAPLAAALGQPVTMDNRPGAGTMLASELTAKSPPDGYTLLMVTNSHTINAGIHKNLRYDPIEDFSPISFVSTLPYLLVVHPSVPARSAGQLIALARKHPGKLYFSSAGAGSGTHLAFELFISLSQIDAVHVPYKSGSPALVDLAGGHVQMMISNIINCMPYVRNKRLVALGISTAKPSPLFPGLPTIASSGLPGYAADAWYGVLAPARVPSEIVARLNREVNAILRTADVREKLAAQGAEVAGSTPDEFTSIMRREIQKWAKVTAGLKLQIQ
ncbi:MAG TPA: tripartite tricarboxylate transporter substrate binding protein [Burkholderiales bacterium]|nr:tripartite tricarboxylate transporter substrate binding protein [Burkholderiales bacterium]